MAGFKAVDSAVGGWNAYAAAAVCAEGHGEETAGYGVGGAAGGAAGVVVRVMGIEGRAGRGVVVRCVCWWGGLGEFRML